MIPEPVRIRRAEQIALQLIEQNIQDNIVISTLLENWNERDRIYITLLERIKSGIPNMAGEDNYSLVSRVLDREFNKKWNYLMGETKKLGVTNMKTSQAIAIATKELIKVAKSSIARREPYGIELARIAQVASDRLNDIAAEEAGTTPQGEQTIQPDIISTKEAPRPVGVPKKLKMTITGLTMPKERVHALIDQMMSNRNAVFSLTEAGQKEIDNNGATTVVRLWKLVLPNVPPKQYQAIEKMFDDDPSQIAPVSVSVEEM